MGHQLGFNELGSNSIWQTLHANEELDNSELLAIDNEITDKDTSELSTSESPEERQVKLWKLQDMMKTCKSLKDQLMNFDKNIDWCMQVQRNLEHDFSCYKKIFDELNK